MRLYICFKEFALKKKIKCMARNVRETRRNPVSIYLGEASMRYKWKLSACR